MPFVILSVLIQVALVIHIIKTGRDTKWIWIIVTLPLVGSLAYLFIELLPGAGNTQTAQRATTKLRDTISPDADLKGAAREFSTSETVASAVKLAAECLEHGHYDEGKEVLYRARTGIHVDDPEILFGIAQCEFGLEHFKTVRELLEELIEKNPDYQNQDAHLLYARSLEAVGDTTNAELEYTTLHGYATGPRASLFYAKFLRNQGQQGAAREVFTHIVNKAQNAGRHYNKLYREIISEARRELRE